MQEDHQIIEQVLQGNQQAYSRIVDKYKRKIYTLLLRMIGQPQDAQDLTQEVFIKAFYRLDSLTSTEQFSGWLYRVATNHCLDELRRRKKVVKMPFDEAMLQDLRTPEAIYLEKELKENLQRQVLALSEDYRIVFLLRHAEHLSYQEISDVLDIPVSTVQVRLFRARKKLLEFMEKSQKGRGCL